MYTMQPSAEARSKQMDLWREIVLQSHQSTGESLMVPATWELFTNTTIDRSLSQEGRREVVESLIGKGNAEWDNEEKSRVRLIFKSPKALASEVYLYVQKQGLQGQILTVFELHGSEEHSESGFAGTDPVLFLRGLEVLEEEGKCAIFQGESMEENGVKFS